MQVRRLRDLRWSGGGLMAFSGTALLYLLTTTPPPGRYYPWWAFGLAVAGIVVGASFVLASFIIPEAKSPEQVVLEQQQRVLEQILDELRADPGHELTQEELEERTNLEPEVIERVVQSPRAEGSIRVRSTARGQVVSINPAIEHDEAGHVEPRGGSQTASPGLIDQKGTLFDPTIVQDDRPGWRAGCEVAGSEIVFGRGVFLSVESQGEEAVGLRCRVFGPTGQIFDSTQSVFEEGSGRGTTGTKHFPGEFNPKSEDALPAGEYEARWFGDIGDALDPKEMLLVSTTFKINEGGQFYCRGQRKRESQPAEAESPSATEIKYPSGR